jgi:hypothetical protein
MSVNRKQRGDFESLRLEALANLANAADAASLFAAMRRLYYSVLGVRWEIDRADARRNAVLLSGIHEMLRSWFDTIIDRGNLEPVIEEVGEALDDVQHGTKPAYFYKQSLGRFELEAEISKTQPPHAVVALAMRLLLDDTSPRRWRERLCRCAYRNCQNYFFVTGKRSGQRYCSPGHSNCERVIKHRHSR